MIRWIMAISCTLASFTSSGVSVSVDVVSKDKVSVNQVVVYLEPETPRVFEPPTSIATMDQVNKQFLPHILAIQKGTQVAFPNSDSIKHHVYSFSPAKVFELQLYKGLQAEPLPFQKAGEVELGCNVHDWMLGYIFVVDTPYFSQTDMQGEVVLDVPAGNYHVKIWHPRIQDDDAALTQTVSITAPSQVSFVLKQPLLEGLDAFETLQDDFSEYE